MSVEEMKEKAAAFINGINESPRKLHAFRLWPESAKKIMVAWSDATFAAHVNGDVQSAEGYLATAQEKLDAIMDKYDDLASDPLP